MSIRFPNFAKVALSGSLLLFSSNNFAANTSSTVPAGLIDKFELPQLKTAYVYETDFMPIELMKQKSSSLVSELGANFPMGSNLRWKTLPVGESGFINSADAQFGMMVYANGFVQLRVEDRSNNAARKKVDYSDNLNTYFSRAYRLGSLLGVFDATKPCAVNETSAGQDLMQCGYVDLKHVDEVSRSGSKQFTVFLNPRIVVGLAADGREVYGSLRGAGIKVRFDEFGKVVFIDARPLRVVNTSRKSISQILSPDESLQRIAHLLRSTGFDPFKLLSLAPLVGYSVVQLPADVDSIPSAPELEHMRPLRADEIAMIDPALPPPLLRPSYLFGMGIATVPVEPKAIPFDTEINQFVAIKSTQEDGEIVSYEVETLKSSPDEDVRWFTIDAESQLVEVGQGNVLPNPLAFGQAHPLIVTLSSKGSVFSTPHHSLITMTPFEDLTKKLQKPNVIAHGAPLQCGKEVAFSYPVVSKTLSTDLIDAPFDANLAGVKNLHHLSAEDRVRYANLAPQFEWDRFRDNYSAVTSISDVYEVKVDKIRPVSDRVGRSGPILDRQAGIYFAFSFDYKVLGAPQGSTSGTFQSDLCDANPTEGAVICHGGFGEGVLEGGEQEIKNNYGGLLHFQVDQRYMMKLGEDRLGHIDARYIHDPVKRADGGPGPPPGYGFRTFVEDSLVSIFFAVGPGLPEAIMNTLTLFMNQWELSRQVPDMALRMAMLGLSRPAVTSSVSINYVPDPCLTLRDIKVFCEALGDTRRSIVPGVDSDGPYCTGMATQDLTEAELNLPVLTSNHVYYSMMEVKPSFATANLFVEERQGLPIPSVANLSGRFMTNLSILTGIEGVNTRWNLNNAASNILLNYGGILATVTPNMYTGDGNVRTFGGNAVAGSVWDNIHMKDHNPNASPANPSVVPGNIVVPGCSPFLPYWYRGVKVQFPDGLTSLILGQISIRTLSIILDQLLTWRYSWDQVPDCIHRHSNWSHSMSGSTEFFFDRASYESLIWALVEADYDAGKPDFRPIQKSREAIKVCSRSDDKIPYNPPWQKPNEEVYDCKRTKLIEVGVNMGGTFHHMPTFFTE